MKGIFIVFVVFSIGCSNYSHDADDKVAISIFISELDLQNLNNKSSELIEDYYYVKLETIDTMNLIGRIDKVVFYNKKYLFWIDLFQRLFSYLLNKGIIYRKLTS